MTSVVEVDLEEDELLVTAEVSTITRIPEGTLRRWRGEGIGPKSFAIGRHIVYRKSGVYQFLREQELAEPAR